MLTFLRTHWTKISTGLLLALIAGVGGKTAYERLAGDCCKPGAACCYPGSPCCHGHDRVAER